MSLNRKQRVASGQHEEVSGLKGGLGEAESRRGLVLLACEMI